MDSDPATLDSFGKEWKKFSRFTDKEIKIAGDEYFDIVPKELVHRNMIALDVGCGSGRWARYLSNMAGHVDAIDPSEAIFHAARVHADRRNIRWSKAGTGNMPFADGTFDLVICLGVLHHVPDTLGALRKVMAKTRPGGHLLLYLYYALDGRGRSYRALFHITDFFRRIISRSPGAVKRTICDLIAWTIYLPIRTIVRAAKAIAGTNTWWRQLPLSYYHNKSMRILRNDALDRFGTPVDKRFTKAQVRSMLEAAGSGPIVFSGNAPYWHVLAQRPL